MAPSSLNSLVTPMSSSKSSFAHLTGEVALKKQPTADAKPESRTDSRPSSTGSSSSDAGGDRDVEALQAKWQAEEEAAAETRRLMQARLAALLAEKEKLLEWKRTTAAVRLQTAARVAQARRPVSYTHLTLPTILLV